MAANKKTTTKKRAKPERTRLAHNVTLAAWCWDELDRRAAAAEARGDRSSRSHQIESAVRATMPPELRAKLEGNAPPTEKEPSASPPRGDGG